MMAGVGNEVGEGEGSLKFLVSYMSGRSSSKTDGRVLTWDLPSRLRRLYLESGKFAFLKYRNM